ncbi:MAG: hypothetical protein GY753_09800 [Gammaproteobacteria bacterium]|nr:hypothetical protein [Gammaproteobacteria bacterium]
MLVKAKMRGEFPLNHWREPGEVFDYTGPAKVPAVVKQPDGTFINKGTRDGLPRWVEKVSAAKAKASKPEPSQDELTDPAV